MGHFEMLNVTKKRGIQHFFTVKSGSPTPLGGPDCSSKWTENTWWIMVVFFAREIFLSIFVYLDDAVVMYKVYICIYTRKLLLHHIHTQCGPTYIHIIYSIVYTYKSNIRMYFLHFGVHIYVFLVQIKPLHRKR